MPFGGDRILPAAEGAAGLLQRLILPPEPQSVGMIALQPHAPMPGGIRVAGVNLGVVESEIRPVPQAILVADRRPRRRLIRQHVLEIGGLEVRLADQRRGIAGRAQRIAHDWNRLAEVHRMVEDLMPALTAAGDHAGPGRHADRIGRIRPVEAQPIARQSIHRRRADVRVVVTHGVPALLVRRDEQEIRSLGFCHRCAYSSPARSWKV